MNKTLKVMTSAALLAGVVAPVAVTTVSADSSNVVSKTPSVSDQFDGVASNLIINEDNVQFKKGEVFRLVLPEGVKWNYSDTTATAIGTGTQTVNVIKRSDSVLEVTLVGDGTNFGSWAGTPLADVSLSTTKDKIEIPMDVEVDGATGPVQVEVDPIDSTVSAGKYTFMTVGKGKTVATVSSVATVGGNSAVTGGTIRIDESAIGAVPDGTTQTVTLKLPSGFVWSGFTPATDITFGGGFDTAVAAAANGTGEGNNENTYKFSYTVPTNTAQRGTIYIKPQFKADNADYGKEVVVSLSSASGDITAEDIKVADYADYGFDVKVEEVKEIVAGKNSTDTNFKIAKFTVKESIPGSFIRGRSVDIELPDWVKVATGATVEDSGDVPVATSDLNSDRNKFSVAIPTTLGTGSKQKIEFKVPLTIQAGKSGDIEAVVKGAGVADTKVVVAKAVSAVSVEAQATNVMIGLQEQKATDIIISENIKGAFKKNGTTNDTVTLKLPTGVSFAKAPKIEVIEGNLEVDQDSVTRPSTVGGSSVPTNSVLQFKIKSEGTKASKIKISDVQLTVDRTVPEGPIEVSLGGNSLVDNNTTGFFPNNGNAAKFKYATTVTPAPGKATAQEVAFKIGATTYTVDGVSKDMDVAPFVEAGRTYMPIRYVAEAVGVNTDSIFWDQATQTATLIKGDRVVQLTAGSKSLKVNGASITMDAAAKVKDGRTVLPVRFVGQALGATVDYDATAQTVTVK